MATKTTENGFIHDFVLPLFTSCIAKLSSMLKETLLYLLKTTRVKKIITTIVARK